MVCYQTNNFSVLIRIYIHRCMHKHMHMYTYTHIHIKQSYVLVGSSVLNVIIYIHLF